MVGVAGLRGARLGSVQDHAPSGSTAAVYSGGPAFDAVIDELEGANVLRVDTDAAERELESDPVGRRRPGHDRLSRTARRSRSASVEPSIAYQGADGQLPGARQRGASARRDRRAAGRVPRAVRDRSDAADLEPARWRRAGYRAAATLVQALTPQMRARGRRRSPPTPKPTDLRDARRLGGEGGIEVRFGAAEDLVDKLVRLQTALTDPDPEEVPTEMIDVSGTRPHHVR